MSIQENLDKVKIKGSPFDEELPDFSNTANETKRFITGLRKLDNPGYVCFDIETGENNRSELFKPEFKQPRITASGKPHASDKSIEDQLSEWKDKTPLSATTGMILAIGYNIDSKVIIHTLVPSEKDNVLFHQTERSLIEDFWKFYTSWKQQRKSIWGFNIKSFDLPFIAQRSFFHGIEVPIKNWQSWNLEVNDLKEIWQCGRSWQEGTISFDNLCKYMGLEPKIDNGTNFAKNFLNQETRHLAISYLEDEMIKQGQLAEKFGAKRKVEIGGNTLAQ